MKKVIFVASSGGHLSEILKLKELFNEYEYLLVTEKTQVTSKLDKEYRMEYLKYGPNKNKIKYLGAVLYNVFKSINILLKFKPKTVISTGAQVGGIMCFFAKLMGKRVIYIESLAKVRSLSTTGKMIYPFANKFYVQWESLEKKYKKAEYLGRLM